MLQPYLVMNTVVKNDFVWLISFFTFSLYTMTEAQKTIYMAMLKTRHESLMNEAMDKCQDFWFETPKDMLDDYEAEWLTEQVCYNQWYLAWMQYALSLLNTKDANTITP